MRNLSTLGGETTAKGINNRGQIVGASERHASLWGVQKGMRELGTLGGSYSSAWGINDRGQIVGVSATVTGEWHATLWTR